MSKNKITLISGTSKANTDMYLLNLTEHSYSKYIGNNRFDYNNLSLDNKIKRIAQEKFNKIFDIEGEGYPIDKCFMYSIKEPIGFIYSMPIIIETCKLSEGETLIISNPDSFLHPSEQSRLCEMLIDFSINNNNRIILSSNSDTILNTIRIAVLYQQLRNYEVDIKYFIANKCINIYLHEDGSIEDWPEGFFDQIDKDLSALFPVVQLFN